MVDVALRWQPARARGQRRRSQSHGVQPGEYLLLTAHRAGNVDDPSACARWWSCVRGAARSRWSSRCTPARARACARRGCWRSWTQIDGRAPERAARVRRVRRAAVRRARGGHRLRRRPEGGVPCRGALRHAASQHRVGGDRAERLEHARGPRRRAALAALERDAARASARSCTATATPPSAAWRRSGPSGP